MPEIEVASAKKVESRIVFMELVCLVWFKEGMNKNKGLRLIKQSQIGEIFTNY